MALTKYIAQTPSTVTKPYIAAEYRKVQLSIDSIINILEAINVPIEIGPPNSAGVGFRALRIPN